MLTTPNQSSVAKAFQECDDTGWMKPSSGHDRVVDVMENPCASPSLPAIAPPT
jgi:arsenic resistance protein ArsH